MEIPAYEAVKTAKGVSRRMLEILMHCVSTRSYSEVIPEIAQTVGGSKSALSREFIEPSEEELRKLCERRFDEVEFLVIYLDGMEKTAAIAPPLEETPPTVLAALGPKMTELPAWYSKSW